MFKLEISALGQLQITLNGQPITQEAYHKVWALLLFLAATPGRAHPRPMLADLLWPDQSEERARGNLRQALTRLRQAIDDKDTEPPFVLSDRETIQFNAASAFRLDVATFTDLLAACASHAHRQAESCPVCAGWRAEAVALYRGPFLDDFAAIESDRFEQWVIVTRESLHQQALGALAELAIYHERRGDYTQALQASRRQLELDPWREEAHRDLMRVLALSGERSAALAQYDQCCRVLQDELGVSPAAETTALYQRIRDGEMRSQRAADQLALPAARTHNLPAQPTPFIGREDELARLADLLARPDCRLLTLVGPGGIGKTRLALQAATEQIDALPDGVAFVSLARIQSAELLIPTIADALHFTLDPQAAPLDQLLHYLRDKELLLVLDNFEHLLAGAGETSAILQDAPGVLLLITSRERLNLQGEWLFEVGGLKTQMAAEEKLDEAQTGQFEAYSAPALFLQTARRVRHDFKPTTADKSAILRICHLVQGMPLALELAAAWLRTLSCAEIADEIEKNVEFLTTTLRDIPARHRSIQAVFDRSWRLLSRDEQRVLAGCSVFRGGFTRDAAAQVLDAGLPLLAALVDKSLLHCNTDGRYEIHELVRQYAARKLDEMEQTDALRSRHLSFFMQLVEAAEPQMRSGEQCALWFDRVEAEQDNLRAALDWAMTSDKFEPGMRIVAAAWQFWMVRSSSAEGQRHAERFLAHPHASAATYLRARMLHTAGVLAFYQGRLLAARAWLTEAIEICRRLGSVADYVLAEALIAMGYTQLTFQDLDSVEALAREILRLGQELEDFFIRGHAFNQLGHYERRRGNNATARQHFLDSFANFEAAGQNVMRAQPLMQVGRIAYKQGDYATAQRTLDRSLAICEALGDEIRTSGVLRQLGHLALAQGEAAQAEEFYMRALALIRRTGNLTSLADNLDAQGRLAQHQGSNERARVLHQESLDLAREIGQEVRIARSLEAFASLAAGQGEGETAARLWGATARFFDAIEVMLDSIFRPERERWIALVRTQLGETTFEQAWAAGATMTLDEAAGLLEA